MMPWFTLWLFFVAMAPVAAIAARTLGRGAAGLFLLTAVVSFVTYEGMHALYHLPSAVLARLRLRDNRVFRFLYAHHRHHHRLKRMRWTNFNISMPLADRCYGTIETEAAWLAEREQRAQPDASPGRAPHPADDDKHAA
jgi:sterol desaturase/sphingolipid hydroxylase (fatty acid hydroxylase superfamily)